jgi:hypothetical protein
MKKFDVITPADMKPYPEKYESTAAAILAQYFKMNVSFVKRTNRRTADIMVGKDYWELKSPTGNSKNTMENNLRRASGQSKNIVIDMRRCKMHIRRAESRIHFFLSGPHKIGRLLLIDKYGKVLVIK